MPASSRSTGPGCSTSTRWCAPSRRAITLVAVMAANNETGVLQPVREVADAVHHRSPRAAVFSDAVQAAPFLDLREVCAGADLVSISAHKVGGPVGNGRARPSGPA